MPLADVAPPLLAKLRSLPGTRVTLHLVLEEDEYESKLGDGRFLYACAAFFDEAPARAWLADLVSEDAARRKAPQDFGMLYVLQGLAFTYSVNPVGQAAPTFYGLYEDSIAGVPVLLLLMAGFWAICWYVARQTAFGKHLYAVGGDSEAARLAGVRTTRVSFASYVICSLLAAAAGLLELTQTYVGTPDLGATLLLTTISAVVIGGVSLFGGEGSLIGVLGGALVLAFLGQFFDSVQVNAFYQQLIEGLIILALLGIYRQKVKR